MKPKAQMKNILLVVVIDTHFSEMSRLARMLKETGKYEPILWFQIEYPTAERDIQICESEGWMYTLSFTRLGSVPPSRPAEISLERIGRHRAFRRALKRNALELISIAPKGLYQALGAVLGLYYEVQGWISLSAQTKSIIRKYEICLLIFAEDNVGYFTHIVSGTALCQGVFTVVTPYTIANASEAAEAFYSNPNYMVKANIKNWLVGKLFRHWVFNYKGQELLRMLAASIIAMELSGFGYRRPWVLNSDSSSIVAVENQRMLEYYRGEKIQSERLVLTGAVYDDVLANAALNRDGLRKELYKALDLIEGRRLLLCAMPPSQFPRECEFEDYVGMAAYWMQALSSVQGWNVIVRPHPRQTRDDIKMLESFGVKVTTLDTASLVPLCDLYVASVSATIRWAIACGKPVINYDVYRMNYKDYSGVKGVITMTKREDFMSALNKLTTDKAYFDSVQKAQQAESQYWGTLDGKSSERILKLIDDMIAKKYS